MPKVLLASRCRRWILAGVILAQGLAACRSDFALDGRPAPTKVVVAMEDEEDDVMETVPDEPEATDTVEPADAVGDGSVPGVPTVFSLVCASVGRVSIQGYPVLPDTINGDLVPLWVYETAPYEGLRIDVELPIGEGPNSLADVLDEFKDTDLLLTANNPAVQYQFSDRALFSGIATDGPAGSECLLTDVIVQ